MTEPRADTDQSERRELLDIPGLARYIHSSVRHVRRLVAERRVPHYKVGHFVRFNPDEIDTWLQRHPRGPNDGVPAA